MLRGHRREATVGKVAYRRLLVKRTGAIRKCIREYTRKGKQEGMFRVTFGKMHEEVHRESIGNARKECKEIQCIL